jgi:hypothetical protein
MTVTLNLPPEKEARLIAAAQAKGFSTDALVREALDRVLTEAPTPLGQPCSPIRRPISRAIREIWSDMPVDVRAKLPRDGASQVDHYVYGLPKSDQ